jgi:hypothetical protein
VVLTVAIFEEFLKSVLSFSCHKREAALRGHFAALGNPAERATAATCDRPTLVRMVRRRVSFRQDAQQLRRVFDVAFGFSPWPSPDAATLILDLVRLRQVIVHEGGRLSAESAAQFATAGVIDQTEYQDLVTHRLNQNGALLLWGNATNALIEQAKYFREGALQDPIWARF